MPNGRKADAIADAYKQATQMMQAHTNSVVNAVTRPGQSGATVPVPPTSATREWFVSVDSQPAGPYSAEEICSRIQRGEIDRGTLVWRDGIEWSAAAALPEFCNQFSTPPPPPA